MLRAKHPTKHIHMKKPAAKKCAMKGKDAKIPCKCHFVLNDMDDDDEAAIDTNFANESSNESNTKQDAVPAENPNEQDHDVQGSIPFETVIFVEKDNLGNNKNYQ